MQTKKDPVTGTPKQKPRDMSPKDRQSTFVHLAETVQYNALHSLNHAKAAAKIAARMAKAHKDDPDVVTMLHNAQHSAKHALDVQDHSKRLMEHLRSYPGGDAAFKELMNPKPTDVPVPPNKTVPTKRATQKSKR